MPLRVFVGGRASDELDALRRRLAADQHLEIVDRAELAEAVITLPSRLSLPRRSSDASDKRRPERLIEALTMREHDVLALVADGLSNREVAHELAISEHTVKFHLGSSMNKLGAASRAEAVALAIRRGLISV